MKTILLRFVVCGFVFALMVFPSQAQSSTAHLSGTLLDPSGAAVAGVRVVASVDARSSGGEQTWSATSGADGEYALELPAGRYRVRFAHSSFVEREMVLDFSSGQNRTMDLRLQIQPTSENVVVTSNTQPLELAKTPAPVDVIGRQEIEQRQAVSLPDLLTTQPGIALARTGPEGGLATIFLDGGDSAFTKVLVDGTPINEPGGDLNFSNLTLDNVDKVEIVHGAESALYGTDAMAGVIQIVSHQGTTRIPAVNLFTEGGGFSSARGGGQVSGLLGRFDYSAAGSYFETDGQGINDGFLNRSVAANFGYRFSDTNQLRLTVRSNSSFGGTPGQTLFADIFPPDATAFDSLKQLSGNLTWTFNTGTHWSHRITGNESRVVDKVGFPDFDFFATDQFNRAGILEESTYTFRQGAATAGYQYEAENAYPSDLSGVHARRNNQAGFIDARWVPIARLTLSAGARAEANTNFGTRVVPRAGAVFALRYGHGFWGDTRVRAAYGQGIEEPTVFESFSSDPCNPGDPSLRPQRSRTLNAGIDQYLDAERFRVSVTFFNNEFRDLINQTVGPANPICFSGNEMLFFNTDLSRARGVNWSATAHIKRWLSVTGNYSFDDSRVLRTIAAAPDVEQPGNHLLRRPVNSGNVWINSSYRRLNLNLAGYFTGVRTDSDFDGLGFTRNPGYARFDIATSYLVTHNVSFYGRVTNLFDKQYQDAIGFPALGRDFRLGVRYNFAGRD
ncbi:MAG TPA: TonB-dependent receptor [Candidatus Acidoferrum sp.]|jgi:vitamin B12 transporter